MYEIRTYTITTREALEQYADVHWQRHIDSLQTFGVTTHRVFTEINDDVHRLIAIVEYEAGANPEAVTKQYMASKAFRADMSGFPMDAIADVRSVFVEPASSDPSR